VTIWVKVVMALVPVLIGALTTVAVQNSHSISLLTQEYSDIKAEQAHQRDLLEQRLAGCK
jgi:hypothetical protein